MVSAACALKATMLKQTTEIKARIAFNSGIEKCRSGEPEAYCQNRISANMLKSGVFVFLPVGENPVRQVEILARMLGIRNIDVLGGNVQQLLHQIDKPQG